MKKTAIGFVFIISNIIKIYFTPKIKIYKNMNLVEKLLKGVNSCYISNDYSLIGCKI